MRHPWAVECALLPACGIFSKQSHQNLKCTQSKLRLLCLPVLFARQDAHFFEFLMCGSHFVCVLVLPDAYNNIQLGGDFWKVFRVQRNACLDSGYGFMRQSFENLSFYHVLLVDPGSPLLNACVFQLTSQREGGLGSCRRLLSRLAFLLLSLVLSTLQTTSNA